MSDFEDLLRQIIREEVINALSNIGLGKFPASAAQPKAAETTSVERVLGWRDIEQADIKAGKYTRTMRVGNPCRAPKIKGKHGFEGLWVIIALKERDSIINAEIRQAWNLPSRTVRLDQLEWVRDTSATGKRALARMRRF